MSRSCALVTILTGLFFLCETSGQALADQVSMIVKPAAKHDAGGQLLPYMPCDEVLDRSMSFIFDTLDTWFKGGSGHIAG